MNVIVTITGTCAGGNHVFVDVTIAGVTQQMVFIKGDLLSTAVDNFIVPDQKKAIFKEIRRLAKAAGIQTFAALKTFCTNLSITI